MLDSKYYAWNVPPLELESTDYNKPLFSYYFDNTFSLPKGWTITANISGNFIDYLPATAEDLSGMRTQDVKKVEYLMHPSDARFQGAKYVINFVMQKYEWGAIRKSRQISHLESIVQRELFTPK